MTSQARIYRDRRGLYVGVLRQFPGIFAVGYTPDQTRRNLKAAFADLARSGMPEPAAAAQPSARQRSASTAAQPTGSNRA